MCTGRVRPEHIARALGEGADGVLVLGCHPQDCHYRSGNLRARALVRFTERMLEGLGVNPARLRLEWISASEGTRFVQVVNDYTQALRRIGPFAPTEHGTGRRQGLRVE
jgi:F420-non-reducing hydrogenase iron-sulfur subunit